MPWHLNWEEVIYLVWEFNPLKDFHHLLLRGHLNATNIDIPRGLCLIWLHSSHSHYEKWVGAMGQKVKRVGREAWQENLLARGRLLPVDGISGPPQGVLQNQFVFETLVTWHKQAHTLPQSHTLTSCLMKVLCQSCPSGVLALMPLLISLALVEVAQAMETSSLP